MGLDLVHVFSSERHHSHLICVVCKQLASLDSFATQHCNHLLCKECAMDKTLLNCPSCSREVGERQCLSKTQPLALKILGKVFVACPNRHEKNCDCEWSGDYDQLQQHLDLVHPPFDPRSGGESQSTITASSMMRRPKSNSYKTGRRIKPETGNNFLNNQRYNMNGGTHRSNDQHLTPERRQDQKQGVKDSSILRADNRTKSLVPTPHQQNHHFAPRNCTMDRFQPKNDLNCQLFHQRRASAEIPKKVQASLHHNEILPLKRFNRCSSGSAAA
mmetsp:Transcript_30878/g.47101  ORF Transcript_30878/g.47101 Transcript_30878/m.47101 type:complete len:273 (-) Transcript_30878:122-940(-)|eukprot:CAMPEP_0194203514 /NCGR_PEP_ID=MMETSP0156-20130528/3262_1 /TAXON_ID=33649 /ORGANISM="Thalassionema nitzschioides, Strain L26-B" /LENGTH=272 /DNA_ID=CAMNT_0038929275 /DNA_START=248 /DNA_END=1066 /DNA_ORIENTATION=+